MFQVIAYYKFTPILDPEKFCDAHKGLCQSLTLKGRVYIAAEGINGTVAGSAENISVYKDRLLATAGFSETQFKTHSCQDIPFDRLIVKTRPEIVSLKAPIPLNPQEETATFLSPAEWRKMLESDADFVLRDVRNECETRIGHFEKAVLPPLDNFFDFPKWLDKNPLNKDKKVLMYCTGGIRCEKFSALMKKKGFTDVNQLQGGILNYTEQEGGAHFKGKCFVFDDRMSVPVDPSQTEPISRCEISGVPCDTYINCANMVCNKLFLCSREAAIAMQGCCSEACRQTPTRRPLQIDKLYIPFRRWYKYFETKGDVLNSLKDA